MPRLEQQVHAHRARTSLCAVRARDGALRRSTRTWTMAFPAMPSRDAQWCAAVVLAGVIVRVFVSWTSNWGEQLIDRPELATPVDRLALCTLATLLHTVREMQYLLTVWQVPAEALWRSKGLHHSPLLLMLPSSVLMDPWLSACLWIALDVVSGVALAALAATLAKRAERHVRIVPSFVAAWYVCATYLASY